MCSVSVVLVQCCNNTTLIKISINTGLSVLLVQCAVFIIKFPFSVKFVLKSKQIHTTTFFFLIFAVSKPCWKPTSGQRRARHIYIKGVTVRFGFDVSESRTFNTSCQKQSNQNASWVYYIHPSLALVYTNVDVGILYISEEDGIPCSSAYVLCLIHVV